MRYVLTSHNAMDQRSWDSEINWRSCDIAIEYRAKRFHRMRWLHLHWKDFSTSMFISEKRVSLEEQPAHKYHRFSRGRQNAYMIFEHFFVQPELMKRYEDSQICSTYVCRMTTFEISTYDGIKCNNFERIVQVKNCKTLLIFTPCSCCTNKKPFETLDRKVLHDWRRLQIDQMMRSRNFRVRSEVVERGSVQE